MTKQKTSEISTPAAQTFLDLLAGATLIDQDEIAALVGLVEDFRAVYQHANDRSGLVGAQLAEKAAQAEVDRLVVLSEIGRATQQEVQSARDLHANACATLNSYPRRRAALAKELRSLRAAVDDAAKPLAASLTAWQMQFEPLAESMVEAAVDLLFLAAAADYHAGNYPFVPTKRRELLSWLSEGRHFATAYYGHGETKPPAFPPIAVSARRALIEAQQISSYPIPEFSDAEVAPHHLHSYTAPHADHVHDEDVAQVVANWGR